MIKRLTLIEMLVLVLASGILFIALLTFSVNAQELAQGASKGLPPIPTSAFLSNFISTVTFQSQR
jgi:hypothetical protein